MARHRNGTWWSRWPVIVTVIAVVAVAAWLVVPRLTHSSGAAAASCATGSQDVTVGVAPEAYDWVSDLAGAYNLAHRDLDGACPVLKVTRFTTDEAQKALQETPLPTGDQPPQLWIPQSSSVVDLLRSRPENKAVLSATNPSLASSPLVLAGPTDVISTVAKRTGGGAQFADFLSLIADGHGWGALGHAEWGQVQLSIPDPTTDSTGAGLLAAVAAAAAAVPLADLTDRTFQSDAAQTGLRELPHALARVAPTDAQLFAIAKGMSSSTAVMRSVGLIAATEQQVYRYNSSGDGVPLTAAYPFQGYFAADFPVVAVNGPWVSGFAHRAASDFVSWSREPAQSALLARWGLRLPDGSAGALATASHGLKNSKVTPEPGAAGVAASATAVWRLLSRAKAILQVYDTSASTARIDPATGQSRLDTIREAGLAALSHFQPRDQVGLWEFGTGLDGTKPYRELVPTAPLGSQQGNITQAMAVKNGFGKLSPQGGTGLYATVLAAYLEAQRDYVPGALNVVGLVSASAEADPSGPTLDQVVTQLRQHKDPNRPIAVILVGVGPQADPTALNTIATAVGGIALTSPRVSDTGPLFERGYLAMINRF